MASLFNTEATRHLSPRRLLIEGSGQAIRHCSMPTNHSLMRVRHLRDMARRAPPGNLVLALVTIHSQMTRSHRHIPFQRQVRVRMLGDNIEAGGSVSKKITSPMSTGLLESASCWVAKTSLMACREKFC